jgi:hypothetical protein
MENHLDILINPLVDASWIPPDLTGFLYEMPDMVEEVSEPTISGMDQESCSWEAGPRSVDDIRYDVIMSWVYNNDVIGRYSGLLPV